MGHAQAQDKSGYNLYAVIYNHIYHIYIFIIIRKWHLQPVRSFDVHIYIVYRFYDMKCQTTTEIPLDNRTNLNQLGTKYLSN